MKEGRSKEAIKFDSSLPFLPFHLFQKYLLSDSL
jgi:hypothetical protein